MGQPQASSGKQPSPKSGKQPSPKTGKQPDSPKPGKGQGASKTGKGQDQAGKHNAKKPQKPTWMIIFGWAMAITILCLIGYFTLGFMNSEAGKAGVQAYAESKSS